MEILWAPQPDALFSTLIHFSVFSPPVSAPSFFITFQQEYPAINVTSLIPNADVTSPVKSYRTSGNISRISEVLTNPPWLTHTASPSTFFKSDLLLWIFGEKNTKTNTNIGEGKLSPKMNREQFGQPTRSVLRAKAIITLTLSRHQLLYLQSHNATETSTS